MDPLSRRFLRPNDDVRPLPEIAGVAPRTIEFGGGSCETLRGALYDRADSGRIVVLCLGIRGNHTYLLPYARIVLESGCDVLLFDYRGFGASDGIASALSLLPDTLAAADFAIRHAGDEGDVAIFGLSLGSVLAVATAAERRLAAVITEDLWIPDEMLDRILGADSSSGLVGLARRALETTMLPALDPRKNLARYSGPALLLHGDRDPLLPPSSTARVVAARPEATRAWFLEGAGHAPESLETHDREYRAQVGAFLDEAFGERRTDPPRASIAFVLGDRPIVSLDPGSARFVQITLTDGHSFRHVRRAIAGGSSAKVTIPIDSPFHPTQAFATPIHWAREDGAGGYQPTLSKLTTDLLRFRRFEERLLAITTRAPEHRVALATAVLDLLPAAGEVAMEVRPRYALALASLAESLQSLDIAVARTTARNSASFVPASPEDWVEIGSGHFAIGLRDERLSRVLSALAREGGSNLDDSARLSDLARRVRPIP